MDGVSDVADRKARGVTWQQLRSEVAQLREARRSDEGEGRGGEGSLRRLRRAQQALREVELRRWRDCGRARMHGGWSGRFVGVVREHRAP